MVALHNGPMLTSEFLSNPEYRKKINEIGGAYSDEICRKRDLEHVPQPCPRFQHDGSASVTSTYES